MRPLISGQRAMFCVNGVVGRCCPFTQCNRIELRKEPTFDDCFQARVPILDARAKQNITHMPTRARRSVKKVLIVCVVSFIFLFFFIFTLRRSEWNEELDPPVQAGFR